jgi:hypothetical protein
VATSTMILAPEGEKTAPWPRRGLVIGAIAVGMAALAAKFGGGSISWGDGAVLACLAGASLLGASEARRLVAARGRTEVPEQRVEGAWMNVVVGSGGPAETAGAVVVPKAPPRNDPERRSLVRRADERRHVGASRR